MAGNATHPSGLTKRERKRQAPTPPVIPTVVAPPKSWRPAPLYDLNTLPKDAIPQAEREADWKRHLSREIERRAITQARIAHDPWAQTLAKTLIRHPVNGLRHFISEFVWTFDPRNTGIPKDVPFLAWPKQLAFLDWWRDLTHEGLVDKARDVGVTWLACACYVHEWLTVPGWVGIMGSRKEDLLDHLGDTKTLFWKMEYIISMLPKWLKPEGWDPKKHRSFCRLINPENGATITGEAGDNMGRGARASRYFIDEWGVTPHDTSVRAAVSKTAQRIVYVTTGANEDTEAVRMIRGGVVERFIFNWTDDPRFSQEWYDDFRRRFGPAITDREVNHIHGDSTEYKVVPADWLRRCVNAKLPAGSLRVAGIDVGGASAESVCAVRTGPYVAIHAWVEPDPTVTALRSYHIAQEAGVVAAYYDSIGIGAGVGGNMRRAGAAFPVQPIEAGIPASKQTYPDDDNRLVGVRRFANIKAEIWWSFRLRVALTLRYLDGQAPDANPDAMVSIPDDETMIAQLSAPKVIFSDDGRIAVESKDALAKRGIASPDRADAVVLAFGFDWEVGSSGRSAGPVALQADYGGGEEPSGGGDLWWQ